MASEAAVRTIEARVHGRYLVRIPATAGPWPTLIGFHGYAEDAERHLEVLQRIPHTDDWLLVAVQALHPFYTREQRVVANWMTRQDRELAIADNLHYVETVVNALDAEFQITSVVFAGFSQGGAMAYRAASQLPSAGLIILAADVPPDVTGHRVLPPVLLGRGTDDAWYTEEKMTADATRLAGLARGVETTAFDGGHEWSEAFALVAGGFLDRVRATGSQLH